MIIDVRVEVALTGSLLMVNFKAQVPAVCEPMI